MEIKNFNLINKGSIIAKFDIYFPQIFITLKEFLYFQSGEKRWVVGPTRQYADPEGKKKYFNFVQVNDDKREAFQRKCLDLIEPFLKEHAAPKLDEQMECPF